MAHIIGILGGSFNPVHLGHIAIAQEVLQRGLADEVWLMLSPLNPLKEHPEALVKDGHRLAMLKAAIDSYAGIKACDIELSMPRPSYTIDTLNKLSCDFPDKEFRLLIGADNWAIFPQWKAWKEILRRFKPIVYPRKGFEMPQNGLKNMPLHDVSSTEIRRKIQAGEDVNNLLPKKVIEYIRSHNLYGA